MMWTTLGLSRDPFDRCPELDDACLPNTMASVLSELMSDLRTSHGVSIVTAEAGSGKSIMVAAFARRLAVTADVAVLEKPASSLPAIARAAFEQLDGDEARGADDPADRDWVVALQERIAEAAVAERSTAIVIDEAHRLSPQTLEDLARMFGDGRSSRLHLFLFGRPRLVERLNAASTHALDDHLLQVVELEPLGVRESVRYLERRLAICGGELLRLFDEAAVDEVVQRAGGCIARLEEIAVEALRRAGGRGATRALVRDVVATARRADGEEEETMAPRQEPLRFELTGDAADESGQWHVGDEGDDSGERWEDEDSASDDEWNAEADDEDEELSWDASGERDELEGEPDDDEVEQDELDEFEDDVDEDDDRPVAAAAKRASGRRRLVGPAVVSLAAGLALVWAANQIPGPSSDAPRGRDAVLFAEPLASKPQEILRLAATAEEADADAQLRAWLAEPRKPVEPEPAPIQVAKAAQPPGSAKAASTADAGPEAATKPAEKKPAAAVTASAGKAEAKPAAAPAKVASAKPAATAPVKPAAAKSASRTPVYTVQLGAFKARRNAEELATKLRGNPTHILEEGGLFRVVSGSFRNKSDATSHEARLKRAGYSTYVRTAVF